MAKTAEIYKRRVFYGLLFSALCRANSQQALHGNPSLVFTPFHANGIYNVGDEIGWTVTPAHKDVATRYTFTARQNNARVIATGTIDLAGGSASITFPATTPEMVLVEIAPVDKAKTPTTKPLDPKQHLELENLLGAAVEPTRLTPSTSPPPDFEEFWSSRLRELAAIPIHPLLTPVPTQQANVTLNKFKLDSVGSHVQGYLAAPSATGKYPAIIMYQSAGVYALKPSIVSGYAAKGWLALDVDSHDMAPDDEKGAPEDYAKQGDTDRETSYFLKMYLRDKRAVDYVRSLDNWDGKTIVLIGTSMGGQQSLVTAGLCGKQITAVITNVAAGADTNGDLHGRKAGYPYWNSKDERVARTALYFDPVNFAPKIEAPVIFGVGLIDVTSPPAGIYTVFNQLHTPKEIIPMVDSGHNNLTPERQEAYHHEETRVLELLRAGSELNLPR